MANPSLPLMLDFFATYGHKKHYELRNSEKQSAANAYVEILKRQAYENGTTPRALFKSAGDFGYTYNAVDENGFLIPYKIDRLRCPLRGYSQVDGVFYDTRTQTFTVSGVKSKSPATNFITKHDIHEIVQLATHEHPRSDSYFSLDAADEAKIHPFNPFSQQWCFSDLNRLQVKRFSCKYLSETGFGRTMYFTDLCAKILFSFSIPSQTKTGHFSATYSYDWQKWPAWHQFIAYRCAGRDIGPHFDVAMTSLAGTDTFQAKAQRDHLLFEGISMYLRERDAESNIGRLAIRLTQPQIQKASSQGPVQYYRLSPTTPFMESSLTDVSEKGNKNLDHTDNDPHTFVGLRSYFRSFFYKDLAHAVPAYGRIWKLMELYTLIRHVVKEHQIYHGAGRDYFTSPYIDSFAIKEFYATGFTSGGVTCTPQDVVNAPKPPPIFTPDTGALKTNAVSSSNSVLGQVARNQQLRALYNEVRDGEAERTINQNSRTSQPVGLTSAAPRTPLPSAIHKISHTFRASTDHIDRAMQNRLTSAGVSVPTKSETWKTAPNAKVPFWQQRAILRDEWEPAAVSPHIGKRSPNEGIKKNYETEQVIDRDGKAKVLPDGSTAWRVTLTDGNPETRVVTIRKNGMPDFTPFLKPDGVNCVVLTEQLVADMEKNPRKGRLALGFSQLARHALGKSDRVIHTSNKSTDYISYANRLAGYSTKPEGYTWHHDHGTGVLMLVEKRWHDVVPHVGASSRMHANQSS